MQMHLNDRSYHLKQELSTKYQLSLKPMQVATPANLMPKTTRLNARRKFASTSERKGKNHKSDPQYFKPFAALEPKHRSYYSTLAEA